MKAIDHELSPGAIERKASFLSALDNAGALPAPSLADVGGCDGPAPRGRGRVEKRSSADSEGQRVRKWPLVHRVTPRILVVTMHHFGLGGKRTKADESGVARLKLLYGWRG